MELNNALDICNLAVSLIGNFGSIMNIDQPNTDKEALFARWVDITRENALIEIKPNFAISERTIGLNPDAIRKRLVGYEYPSDCLQILSVDGFDTTIPPIEENHIWVSKPLEGGLTIRFIRNITDVTKMSSTFKMGWACMLAANVAMDMTQDARKVKAIRDALPVTMANISANSSQENRPVIVARSSYQKARVTGVGREYRRL